MNAPGTDPRPLDGTMLIGSPMDIVPLPSQAIRFLDTFSRRTENVFGFNIGLLRTDIERLFRYKFLFSPYAPVLRQDKTSEILQEYLEFLLASAYFLSRDEKLDILKVTKACPTLPLFIYFTEQKLLPNHIIEKLYREPEDKSKNDELPPSTIVAYELFFQFASMFHARGARKDYIIHAERGDISHRENQRYAQEIVSEALEVLEMFLHDRVVGEYIVSEHGVGALEEGRILFQRLKDFAYASFFGTSELPSENFPEESFRGFYKHYELMAIFLRDKMIAPFHIALVQENTSQK